jgi:hypothetical protein
VTILEEILERTYAELGDERVYARRLTRRRLLGGSRATECVHALWMMMQDAARANRLRPLRIDLLSPRDEGAREWVDRCVALVRSWRLRGERESRGRADKMTSAGG